MDTMEGGDSTDGDTSIKRPLLFESISLEVAEAVWSKLVISVSSDEDERKENQEIKELLYEKVGQDVVNETTRKIKLPTDPGLQKKPKHDGKPLSSSKNQREFGSTIGSLVKASSRKPKSSSELGEGNLKATRTRRTAKAKPKESAKEFTERFLRNQHGSTNLEISGTTVAVDPEVSPVICANDLGTCKKLGVTKFPCRRCHREYYCSAKHLLANAERHKVDCKTVSQIEVMPGDLEYSVWFKCSMPYLYDLCLNFVLVWPSLTVQWLPDPITFPDNSELVRHRILIGSNTSGKEPNHLLICGVDTVIDQRFFGELHVLKRITHDGEIHRARYMPQNSNVIATKSGSKDVFVFCCNDFPDFPIDDNFKPSLRLRGHTKDGYAVSWNPHKAGILASGSSDGTVCLWDINSNHSTNQNGESRKSGGGRVITAYSKYTAPSYVEDVNWSPFTEQVIVSAGDDKKLILWDTRMDTHTQIVENAHDGNVNTAAFALYSENYLATGGSDKVVSIWDIRKFTSPIHSIHCHKDQVLQVQWSPWEATTLASAGMDKKVYILNIEKIARELGKEERGSSAECEFIHGGHVMTVNDISWNTPGRMMASVSDDNILQVWEMGNETSEPEQQQ